jgi:predicted TIM-barrel fold metal-dependent hydrolase
MTDLGFKPFDADNHYYEATDAFTRHLEPAFRKRGMQWAEVEGRRRLVVGGRINRFIPNPQFDPVAKPGVLDDYFRGRSPADDIRGAFGELEPIRPEYRDPKARLEVLDQQGLEGCFLFPTLGVGMEEALLHDVDAAHASFRAFNRWLAEDWGLATDDRMFAAPYLCLLDPDQALDEVDWAIGNGARVIVMRAGPVMHPSGGRSPADPVYDPFWAAVDRAGITVAYHSGEAGYGRYVVDWGESSEFEAFRRTPLYGILTADRPISDTMAALVCGGVFERFPRVRVATIESGSGWVKGLLGKLGKQFSLTPGAFGGNDPVEALTSHLWVAPYYEDDIRELADQIGTDHVLFGSDWPHAEGLADPLEFVDDLKGFDEVDIRRIMRDNALALSVPLSESTT